jgi:colanic acid/amylovoran biosynthesis protein
MLIHCYSDFNKGDLGIILSTVAQLEKISPNSEINGVSTFDYNHSNFKNDHELLKKYINNIYPCIFGLVFFKFRNKEYNNPVLKILKFIFSFLRLGTLLILPKGEFFLKTFLNANEKKTFDELISSDLIISKGGSFLCNENNLRSKMAFFRLVYINLLLKKYDKKYIIFGQSIGPVHGRLFKKILNKVLEGAKNIYLREKLCLTEYPYINKEYCSDIIVNDIAFTLDKSEPVENKLLDSQQTKIGLTVKFPEDNNSYNKMFLGAMRHFIEKLDAIFIIFPQVTLDCDVDKAKELYDLLEDRYKANVFVFTKDYTPFELRYMYSKMDLFIGTRLHSTIFSMSANVPSVNISYHGTKSQGIYNELGLKELVVSKDNFNAEFLIETVDRLMDNKQLYENQISQELEKINKNINLALSPFFTN